MRRLGFAASVAVVLAALALVPLPIVVYSPGDAESVPALVRIDGEEGEVSGDLLLTTVFQQQASVVVALLGWIRDDEAVERERDVLPPGIDIEDYFADQRDVFAQSVEVAAAVGLQLAGRDIDIRGEGALIEGILPGSPAAAGLRVGDVITAVDGDTIEFSVDLSEHTGALAAGDTISVTVERDGQYATVDLVLVDIPDLGRAGIGVSVSTRNLTVELPVEVTAETDIGGPSAGLMLALTVYDLVDPVDLAAGRIVAGTGTIDLAGQVGNIGGIGMKVRGAAAAGATIFLAPAEQAEQARSAAPESMTVVGVSTADEAAAYLRGESVPT